MDRDYYNWGFFWRTYDFVISVLHRKYDIGVKDKSGWGYRCGKCEREQGCTVWHGN